MSPCPFCGSADIHMMSGEDGHKSYVVCTSCMAEGPTGDSDEDALERWNQRRVPSIVADHGVIDALTRAHRILSTCIVDEQADLDDLDFIEKVLREAITRK